MGKLLIISWATFPIALTGRGSVSSCLFRCFNHHSGPATVKLMIMFLCMLLNLEYYMLVLLQGSGFDVLATFYPVTWWMSNWLTWEVNHIDDQSNVLKSHPCFLFQGDSNLEGQPFRCETLDDLSLLPDIFKSSCLLDKLKTVRKKTLFKSLSLLGLLFL